MLLSSAFGVRASDLFSNFDLRISDFPSAQSFPLTFCEIGPHLTGNPHHETKQQTNMKKIFATIAGVSTLVLAFNATNAFADDKEVTISGSTKCSACSLHEGTSCHTVLQTKVDGKTVNYYLVENDASKKLDKLADSGKKVTATGTVAEVDGKQKLTVTKFEVVKNQS